MPKARDFTPAQSQVIRATARKIWHKQFEWMKAVRATKTSPARPGGQEAMALALGLSQQTISSLLDEKSTYKPGYKVATAIANLDGKTLDDLIGEYAHDDAPDSEAPESGDRQHNDRTTRPSNAQEPFSNLTACIVYNASTKQWSPWTVAAARAGFFGLTDFPPPAWTDKLDTLERELAKLRKTP